MNEEQLITELAQYPDQMSSAERMQVYAVGKEVDHIPVSISVREYIAPLYGHSIGEYRRDFAVKASIYEYASNEFGCYGVSIGPNLKKIGEALGAKVVYPEDGIDYLIDAPLTNYTNLANWEPPVPSSNIVLKQMLTEISEYKAYFGDNFPVSTEISGPMSTAISIRPIEMVMRDCVMDTDNLCMLLDFAVECQLKWVRCVNKLFGITSVNIADPAASLNLISPMMFHKLIFPRLKYLVREIVNITHKKPALHICGRTAAIWDDLTGLEISSFRVDNCESLLSLKEAAGAQIAIAGNIPPVDVMLRGSIDQVLASGRNCIYEAADNPMGFTLAAGCQLPPGVSKANLYAMLLAARKYGRNAKKGYPCLAACE